MADMTEQDEATIDAPFIANSFKGYQAQIGLTDEAFTNPQELLNYFNITQAFYAGFTSAINLAKGIEEHEHKQLIRQMIKDELLQFSKANQEFTEKMQPPTQPGT